MKFEKLESILEKDGIFFLTYAGFLTQPLIAGMTDVLEKEAKSSEVNMKILGNIFTIFIELSQNMMNYAKTKVDFDKNYQAKGFIIVGLEQNSNNYYILSRNLVDSQDKEIIEKRLLQVYNLNKEELRILHRQLRKTGELKHHKGAGIGFVEIARRCDKIEYEFVPYKDEQYYYTIKTTICSID